MKSNKTLIIGLIQQDLKHSQLTSGLESVGLDTSIHTLAIVEIVARLMGAGKADISDKWAETYFSCLDQAQTFKISERAEELKPLAEKCYKLLLACENIER